MIDFLAGAITLGHVIAGVCFLRFWRKTGDRLFVHFAVAFWLFAANQALVMALGPDHEHVEYTYLLRVLGFVLILVAILGKNAFPARRD